MKNLFLFFKKIRFFLAFVFFQIIVFNVFISNSSYQQARVLNSSYSLSGWVFEKKHAILDYFKLKKDNQILANQNSMLKQEAFHNYTILTQNEILIDGKEYRKQYLYQPAVVIQNSTRRKKNILTLDVGTEKNVVGEMGVLSSTGIIGFTRDVSTHYCTVISLMNTDCMLPVMPLHDSCDGVLFWDEDDKINTASVKGIPNYFDVKIGDTIVTQGGAGFFPQGEMVGIVISVDEQAGNNNLLLKIKTAVDFNALNHVFVVKNLFKAELDSIQDEIDL